MYNSESSSDYEEIVHPPSPSHDVKSKQNKKNTNILTLTTEGVLYEKKHSYKNLSQCTMCQVFYDADTMFMPLEDDLTCSHCYYWMNYDETSRMNADVKYGILGLCVAKYVLKCNIDHDSTKCTRKTNTGGCFLCEYKIGIKIENILTPEVLYGETAKVEIPKDVKHTKENQYEKDESYVNIITQDDAWCKAYVKESKKHQKNATILNI